MVRYFDLCQPWPLSQVLTTDPQLQQSGLNRPVQKPAVFDGRMSWEAHYTQFEIVADINKWTGSEKAAFVATSL